MHITIVVTDGINQRKVIWVSTTPNSICSGFCSNDIKKNYTTYHADGNLFTHWIPDKIEHKLIRQPSNTFKGIDQLFIGGFSKDILAFECFPENHKKTDYTISADVRDYSVVGCIIYLVEPNQKVTLSKELLARVKRTQCFFDYTPWIYLVLYEADSEVK